MEQTFLTAIKINKVRHLKDIKIPLDNDRRKHLILTGKNGSGKTSVLEALVNHFKYVVSSLYAPEEDSIHGYNYWKKQLEERSVEESSEKVREEIEQIKKHIATYDKRLQNWNSGAVAECNSFSLLREKYQKGELILAYYKADRVFEVEEYRNIEKVEFKRNYEIEDTPRSKFTKYLVDLKATQAFSKEKEKTEKIEQWFERFESILKRVFHDDGLQLIFDEETFQFSIQETGREPFDFNSLSSGYAAVLDIINDLIIRMEANSRLRLYFDIEGIVLIDEIETHLHLELQKEILPILTELFPKLQFIITTHSPFVLSSLDSAVIYDLENKKLVKDGLSNLPYEGIVEGYFRADKLSKELRKKYDRYKILVSKDELTNEEYEEIDELEYYLDEIPDYLATEIITEYNRLKLEFANRG